MATEVLPAARSFRNKLQTIADNLFGTLVIGAAASVGTASVFLDLSWENLLKVAGAVGVTLVTASVNAILAEHAAKRECSISYILALDQ